MSQPVPADQFNQLLRDVAQIQATVTAISNFQIYGPSAAPPPCPNCEALRKKLECSGKEPCSKCLELEKESFAVKVQLNRILSAKYVIDMSKMEHEEICQGIQSTVYSMKIFGSEFAVKQLKDCRNFLDFEHPEFTRDQLFVPMQFRHPHLVEMYGFGLGSTRKDKSLYIIMGLKEFSLDRFYDFAVENKVSFTASQMVKIAKQILSALQYLHSNGVLHGRLTPGNVLLEKISNSRYKVVLSNYGVSTGFENATRTKTTGNNSFDDLYPYWAPEAFTDQPDDPDSEHFGKRDVFSFGITFWELFKTMWTLKTARRIVIGENMMQKFQFAQNERPSLDELPKECVDFFPRTWDRNVPSRFTPAEAFEAVSKLSKLKNPNLVHVSSLPPGNVAVTVSGPSQPPPPIPSTPPPAPPAFPSTPPPAPPGLPLFATQTPPPQFTAANATTSGLAKPTASPNAGRSISPRPTAKEFAEKAGTLKPVTHDHESGKKKPVLQRKMEDLIGKITHRRTSIEKEDNDDYDDDDWL